MALASYLRTIKKDLASTLHSSDAIHIVIGNESCDLDSVVSAIVYAFFLHSTSKRPSPVVLPVLNVPRHHYHLRLEVNAHLTSLGILPQDHLIFIDDPDLDLMALTSRLEVDLSVTLVDHHQMSRREDCLRPFVSDVMDHRPLGEVLPDSWRIEIEGVGSCASLVTHRIMDHGSFTVDPVSAQLLLGAVLSDTVNLSEADGIAKDKDRSAVSRLERSLPAKVTCQGIYDLIKKAKFDLSVLTVEEMLMKDLKVVKGAHITVASSSITMDLEDVLSRVEFRQHASAFCMELSADVLLILTISMGETSISRRCIAVYSENRVYREQITDVLLRASSPNLALQHLDLAANPDHVTAFNQSNLKISRKGILPLISEFLSGEANTPEDEDNGASNNSAMGWTGGDNDDENDKRKSDDDVDDEEKDTFCEMQMRRHINMAKIAQSDHFRTSQDVFDLAAVGTRSLISPSLSSDSACDFDSLDNNSRRDSDGMVVGERGKEGSWRSSQNSSVEGKSGERKVSNSSLLSNQMADMEKREKGGEMAVTSEGQGLDSKGKGHDSLSGCSSGSRNNEKDNVDNITNNNIVATAAAEEAAIDSPSNTNTNLNNMSELELSGSGQIWNVPSYPETPPNSYCMSPVTGQDLIRQTHLPSFNSKEMVERIHEKKKAMTMRNCPPGTVANAGPTGFMTSSASGSEFGPSLTVFGSGVGIASSSGGGSLMSPVVPQNSYTSCSDIAGMYGQMDSPTSLLANAVGNASGMHSAGGGGGGGGGGGVDIPRLARAGIEEKVSEKRSHFNAWSSSPGAGDLSGGPYTPQNSYANSGAGSMINLAENLTSLNSAEVVAKIRAKQAAMFGTSSSRASASSEDSIGGCRSPGGPGGGGKSRGISMESPVHAFTPQNSYKDGMGVLETKGRLTDLNEVVERLSTEKLEGDGREGGNGGRKEGGKRSGSSNSGGDSRDEDVGGGGGGVLSVVGAGGKSGVGVGGGGSARHSSSQSDSQNTMSDVESLLSMSLDYAGTPASDTGSGSAVGHGSGTIHGNIVASVIAGAIRSELMSSASASATPKDEVFTPGGQGQDDRPKVMFGFNHVGDVAAGMETSAGGVNGEGAGGRAENDARLANVVAPPNSIVENGGTFNLMSVGEGDNAVVIGCSRSNSELFSPLNESAMMEDEIEMFQTAESIVSQSIAAAALQMGDGGGKEAWRLANGDVDLSSPSGAGGTSGVSFAPPPATAADGDDNGNDDFDYSSSISDLTSDGVSVARRDVGKRERSYSADCRGVKFECSKPSGRRCQSVGFNVMDDSGKKRVGLSNDSCHRTGIENGLKKDEGSRKLDRNCVGFMNDAGDEENGEEEEEGLTDAALSELAYEWARDLIQGVLDNFPNDSLPTSPSCSRDGDDHGLENGGDGGDDDDVCASGDVPGKGYTAVPRLSIVITDNAGVNMDGLAELAKIGRVGVKEGDEEEDDDEDVDGFSVEALDGSVGDIYREDTVDLDEDEEEEVLDYKKKEFEDDGSMDERNEEEKEGKTDEEFCIGVEEAVGMGKGGVSNSNANFSSSSRKSSRSSSSSVDSSSVGVGGERKWSREMDVSASTIKENEMVKSFPERRCSSEVRFHDILEDYDDSPITSFPGRKISISEDYPRRFSREDSTRRQSNLTSDAGCDDGAGGGNKDDDDNNDDEFGKRDLETEYLPNMDPLHGNLDIVTSNEVHFSTMTDSGREVVEGESFRRVSGHELPGSDVEREQVTPSPSGYGAVLGGVEEERKKDGEKKKDVHTRSGENADANAFSIGDGDDIDDDDMFWGKGSPISPGATVGAPLTPPAVSEIKKAKKKIRVSFSHDIADEELEYLSQVSSPRTLKSPPPPISPSAEEIALEKKTFAGSQEHGSNVCAGEGLNTKHVDEESDDSDDDFELDPSVMKGAREVYLTSAGRISIAGEEEESKAEAGGRMDWNRDLMLEEDERQKSPPSCSTTTTTTTTNNVLDHSHQYHSPDFDPVPGVTSDPVLTSTSSSVISPLPPTLPSHYSHSKSQLPFIPSISKPSIDIVTTPSVSSSSKTTTDSIVPTTSTTALREKEACESHQASTSRNVSDATIQNVHDFGSVGSGGRGKDVNKSNPDTKMDTAITSRKIGVLHPAVKLNHDPLRLGHSNSGTSLCSVKGAVYRDEWQDDEIQDVAGIGQQIDEPRKKIVPDTHLRNDIDDDVDDDDDDDVIVENAENDLEWENDTPIQESQEDTTMDLPRYRTVQASGSLFEMDMEMVSPYKAVLSHGGYYDEGLTAIIVFYGYHLPHRRQADYRTVMNHLFHHVVNILDELVADDYVIVYFHGSTPKQQMPGFHWLRRCYRCIDRRLKKNLKGLFLVHPTLWLRTVVAMTRPFISSKFSSKLKFVRDLQELKSLVPLENITIPPAVLHYDRYREHLPTSSTSSHPPMSTTTTTSSSHPFPSSSSSPSSSPHHQQPTSSLLHASSPHT